MENKMHPEIEIKFRNILTNFLIEQDNITEIILREGNRVGYQKLGKWEDMELDWVLSDDDIRNFQLALIEEKVEDEGAIDKIFATFNEDGHYNYAYLIEDHPFRINWSRGRGKDFMRIRKLPKNVQTPAELGIPQSVRDIIRTYKGGGLFLFTAPPSNGKSTSIASLIQEIAYEQCLNIVTLEDPVEYVYDSNSKSIIEQREIGFDLDSYDTGIEGCMRMGELNIVVVQEMTTPKIIQQIMLLVSKGCMAISTVHSPDTSSAFDSILEAHTVEERPAVLSALKKYFKCFVSQKLVPRADGKGRIAVFEILTNTAEASGFIADGNTKNMHQLLDRPGNLSFQTDFLNKIETGDITIETALEYCPLTRKKDLIRKLGYDN